MRRNTFQIPVTNEETLARIRLTFRILFNVIGKFQDNFEKPKILKI